MTQENKNELKKIIKSICRLEVEGDFIDKILKDEHCNLVEKLGFDSLLIVQLIVEIEELFNIEFDMDSLDVDKFKYIDKLVQEIDNKIGK